MTPFLLLGLATLALATPPPLGRRSGPYPPTSSSTGFTLIANVTNRAHDLSPSVNNQFFSGIHTGAGLSNAALTASTDSPHIFYLNGTAAPHTIAFDTGGTPISYPFSIIVANQTNFDIRLYPTEHSVTMQIGSGIPLSMAGQDGGYAYVVNELGRGTFLACNRTVEYYHREFITVEYAYTEGGVVKIPEGCATVRLLPQCAVLPVVSGEDWSNKTANSVKCYEDVKGIDWSRYGD